jgi:hypothetical protein
MRLCTLGLVIVAVAASGLAPREARADDGASSGIDPVLAAKEVRDADRAFSRHQFRKAGDAYESAFEHSRSPGLLLKAARALWRADEPARVANLLDDYLTLAPARENERQRESVFQALRKLSETLGRIEIEVAPAVDLQSLTLDGAPIPRRTRWITPGSHYAEAQTAKDRVALREWATVTAGKTSKIVLAPEAMASTAATPLPVAARPLSSPASPSTHDAAGHGVSPAVVVAGGVVTAALAGLTIWSGLDTESFKEQFDDAPTRANLDEGSAKQLRTNILLGVTGGAAVATTLVGVFLVDWKGNRHRETPRPNAPQLTFGANSVALSGRF